MKRFLAILLLFACPAAGLAADGAVQNGRT